MIQRILPKIYSEIEDPRYFQILFLGSFLLYGISSLGWEGQLPKYIAILSTAIFTQLIFTAFTTKRYSSVKSALITSLGLCLLLQVNHWSIAVLAAAVAISSKFLIKVNKKHIFNPAAIGIVAALIFSDQAWVSAGQWGSEAILWFLIGTAGLMMVLKVGRLDTSLTFLAVFGALIFFRLVVYLGWNSEVWMHQMNNGSLLLFTFFMITDPMTTPNHKKARIYWAALIGVVLFIATNFWFVQTAAIWTLVLINPLTPLFDKLFKFKKYSWKQTSYSYLS